MLMSDDSWVNSNFLVHSTETCMLDIFTRVFDDSYLHVEDSHKFTRLHLSSNC